jgi:hypothetical protein
MQSDQEQRHRHAHERDGVLGPGARGQAVADGNAISLRASLQLPGSASDDIEQGPVLFVKSSHGRMHRNGE